MKIRQLMSDLPFAETKEDGTIDLWFVQPTGDFSKDYQIGCQYADAYFSVVRRANTSGGNLLVHIVDAMIRVGDDSAIRTGFMSRVEAYIDRANKIKKKHSNFSPAPVPPTPVPAA